MASSPSFTQKEEWKQQSISVKKIKNLARDKLDPKQKPPDLGAQPITLQIIFDVLREDSEETGSLAFSVRCPDKDQEDSAMSEEVAYDPITCSVEEFVPLTQ